MKTLGKAEWHHQKGRRGLRNAFLDYPSLIYDHSIIRQYLSLSVCLSACLPACLPARLCLTCVFVHLCAIGLQIQSLG